MQKAGKELLKPYLHIESEASIAVCNCTHTYQDICEKRLEMAEEPKSVEELQNVV